MIKQWNGLMWREWIQVRGQVVAACVLAVIAMLLFPFGVNRFLTGDEFPVFEIASLLAFMWAGACIFVPLFFFLILFYRSLKRPDLWLHTTASIQQLISVKMVISMLGGVIALLLAVGSVAFWYVVSPEPFLPFDEVLFFGSLFTAAIFAGSLLVMIIGFFFMVVDQLIKPLFKGFSMVITLLLFFLSNWMYTVITSSNFYDSFIRVGRFNLLRFKNPQIDVGGGYFAYTATEMYAGELLVYVAFAVFLFLLSCYLLEQKVRR